MLHKHSGAFLASDPCSRSISASLSMNSYLTMYCHLDNFRSKEFLMRIFEQGQRRLCGGELGGYVPSLSKHPPQRISEHQTAY
jgi:hypothetical protein